MDRGRDEIRESRRYEKTDTTFRVLALKIARLV